MVHQQRMSLHPFAWPEAIANLAETLATHAGLIAHRVTKQILFYIIYTM